MRAGRLKRAVEILTANGHDVTVAPTTGPNTASGIAREHIARGAELILAAGGDGTINEAAEGVALSNVAFGILPAGTANVLATEMGIGSRMERVAERLESFAPRRISVGRLTCEASGVSRHFLLMAGVGLDALIAYNASAAVKARAGKLAYWLAGWRVLGRRLPQFTVEANGQRFRSSFALFSKVRNYGGDFSIAREVTLFEDEFEMVLFEGRSTFRYLKYFAALLVNRHRALKGVTVARTRGVRLYEPEDSRIYAQIDGEVAGLLPARVEIVPDALTLLVPREYAPG